ncbi:MAG: hypothetical protein KA383_00180 [Phycisphaerae bacterium]|nr:hypothetical protein [Phycisphaerae bacterium]
MTSSWSKVRRSLLVLALGGATLATFGVDGCWYALNRDYENLFQASGDAIIQTVSDNYFNFGTDYNTVVRIPTTAFAQALWNNWVAVHVPNDAELR